MIWILAAILLALVYPGLVRGLFRLALATLLITGLFAYVIFH